MPNSKQDRDFKEWLEDEFEIKTSILDKSIEWIQENLSPSDVFGEKKVLEYAADGYSPDEVFDDSVLEAWAISNGYSKED